MSKMFMYANRALVSRFPRRVRRGVRCGERAAAAGSEPAREEEEVAPGAKGFAQFVIATLRKVGDGRGDARPVRNYEQLSNARWGRPRLTRPLPRR